MADVELLKMGRVMDLEPFITRVRAAVLQYAASMALGGTATPEKNFAIHILKNPGYVEVSMVALVAADATVLSQVSFANDAVSSDSVTDAAIKAVVASKWSIVAAKYPTVVALP